MAFISASITPCLGRVKAATPPFVALMNNAGYIVCLLWQTKRVIILSILKKIKNIPTLKDDGFKLIMSYYDPREYDKKNIKDFYIHGLSDNTYEITIPLPSHWQTKTVGILFNRRLSYWLQIPAGLHSNFGTDQKTSDLSKTLSNSNISYKALLTMGFDPGISSGQSLGNIEPLISLFCICRNNIHVR